MGKLVLVPTPIGNLGDITDRAKIALVEADVVLAEDTRTTGKLLKLLGLEAKLRAYHMHNEHAQADGIVRMIADSSGHVALASDAGTPGISDPGFLLVRACIQAGVVVEALPGPTALIPALVASGFPCDRFVFEGFVPQKKGRQTRIQSWRSEARTIVAVLLAPPLLTSALSGPASSTCKVSCFRSDACAASEGVVQRSVRSVLLQVAPLVSTGARPLATVTMLVISPAAASPILVGPALRLTVSPAIASKTENCALA